MFNFGSASEIKIAQHEPLALITSARVAKAGEHNGQLPGGIPRVGPLAL
jgi:hypothetical protein